MAPEFRWSTLAVPHGDLGPDAGPATPLFDLPEREEGTGRYAGLVFLRVRARSIVNHVPDAPYGFRHTVNVYRGCSHACTYCFARPTHAYLGLDAGDDFDRRIVVKVNAAELARVELDPRRWRGDLIAMGTNTDPYQPAEGRFGLTRAVLEVIAERANPCSILTKSGLVLRDLDVLTEAARRAPMRVDFSIATLDEAVWRAVEPGTPHPALRVRALARVRDAGLPSAVLVSPILPGLTDHPELLTAVVRAVVEAGATSVSGHVVYLRPAVREHFLAKLRDSHPDLVPFYEQTYRHGRPPARLAAAVEQRLRRIVEAFGGRWGAPPVLTPATPVAVATRSAHQLTLPFS